MERNFVAALAVVTLFGGGALYGALYFVDAAHEREVVELRRLLQEARQQAAEMEKARNAAVQARVAVEKAPGEGGEIRKTGEPPAQKPRADGEAQREAEAQKAAADAERDAREAARVEAMRIRIEGAKKRAEEETLARERVEQPKLPEVRLTPKPGS